MSVFLSSNAIAACLDKPRWLLFRCWPALHAIAIAFAICISPSAFGQDPEISAELNSPRIFIGESVTYSVMVSNVDNPPEPDLSDFDGFDVQLVGQQSQNSQSTTIINGVRTDSRRYGKMFQYRLTPNEAGTLTIPAPKVEIDGAVIQGKPLILLVKGASDQETVFLKTFVEPADQLFPTQKFTVTLQIDVRRLSGDLKERSPLSIQETVQLRIPWLTADGIANCTPQSEALDVLQPMLAQQRQQDGFGINDLSVGARSLFGRSRSAQFIPPSQDVTRKLKDGSEAEFVRYTIQQDFRAERAGMVRVPAASIKGLFAIPETQPIEGEELYAVSNVTTLKVSDVPTEGRPDTFYGGIGTFEIDATVTPQNAQVGDPMTLTLNVIGDGTLDLIVAPDLANMKEFKDRFRIYEPTSKFFKGGRSFTFTVRPESDQVTELPEIPFSYFDVEEGKYSTVRTAAIPLTIIKAAKLNMNEVIADQPGRDQGAEAAANLQQNKDGLAANKLTMVAATSKWLTWKQWSVLWALIVVATGCLRMLTTAGRNKNSDPETLRRRLAFSNATTALQAAETASSESEAVPADALGRILIGLVADSTGQQASGMTSTETVATLAGLGINRDIQEQTANFLQDCDAARFGASNDDQERLLKRCQDLVKLLAKELKS